MSAVLTAARPAMRRWHRPLLLMIASMLLLMVVSAVGLMVDDRVLLGAPIWGKPFKFALSFAIYGLTLAWLLRLPHKGSRWTGWMATLFAVTGFVDVGIIAIQAARGTFSHFNTADDATNEVIQSIFSKGVLGLMLANLVLATILIFQRVGDRATAWSIRAGMAFVLVGIGVGILIPITAHTQWIAQDAAGHSIPLNSQHSVGVPDGGPGLPLTGWSTTGGDLRIGHFVGLHGLQVMLVIMLLLGFLATRVTLLRDDRTRASLVIVAAMGYAGLTALVTWQALRGQSLTHPDGLTLSALALVVAATAAAGWTVLAVGRRRERTSTPPSTTAPLRISTAA